MSLVVTSCCGFPLRNMVGVSVQDPFSECSDPAFHNKRPGGTPYQQGGGPTDPSMRMQYDANKDPYGGQRKGEEGKNTVENVHVDEFKTKSNH